MKKTILFTLCLISLLLVAYTAKSYKQIPTSLKVTVRNALGNIEEGVEVQLFKTQEDYNNETNPATEILLTNKKGVVTFKGLEPQEYYVSAKKGDANNFGGGEKTNTLTAGRINLVTIIIE
jgi:hypothetical protein